jgi:hypothetical protein
MKIDMALRNCTGFMGHAPEGAFFEAPHAAQEKSLNASDR